MTFSTYFWHSVVGSLTVIDSYSVDRGWGPALPRSGGGLLGLKTANRMWQHICRKAGRSTKPASRWDHVRCREYFWVEIGTCCGLANGNRFKLR